MRPFHQSLPMALLRSRENAMQLFRPMLSAHDLTEQQWRVLRALTASAEDAHTPYLAIEVSDLADATFLLAPSLTRILSNLEARQLVSRTVVTHDQRRASISLTRRGTALVEQIAPESERLYALIEERFGSSRLQNLLDELHDLAALDLDVLVEAP